MLPTKYLKSIILCTRAYYSGKNKIRYLRRVICANLQSLKFNVI